MSNLLPLKDADGRLWDLEELQALVLQCGSFKNTGPRLGLPSHIVNAELRNRGIMPPPEFVRTIAKADPLAFRDSVIREGSTKKAAQWYGVSITHLMKVLVEIGVKVKRTIPSKEEAERALGLFGSALLAARLLGTTPNEIKKACPEWKSYRDPLKTGRQAVSTGRIGEDFWKELRGTITLEETARDQPNHPDYDFIDGEFGYVNVKTSNPTKQKRKDIWTWTWEVKEDQKADVFPLVFLDRNRNPMGYFLVTRDGAGKLVFPDVLRVVIWSNGCYGVSVKDLTDRPNGLNWVRVEDTDDSSDETESAA